MFRPLVLLQFGTFLLLFSKFPTSNCHDITSILAKYPKFSAFNHYLTTTGLAEEINHGMGLTICVVDNPIMRHFLTKWRPSTSTLSHILSLHVLQRHYDATTLRHLPSSNNRVLTLFSDNNHLVFGYPRFVHITDLNGGKLVKFTVKDRINKEKTTYLIRSVISIRCDGEASLFQHQISGILSEPRPKQEFSTVLTIVMNNNFCKLFREKLAGTSAEKIYDMNVESGLTIFCPTDYSFRKFLPKFEKLTEKDKNALLLFHAMPVYLFMYMIREDNGTANTLASDGLNRYDLVIENGVHGLTFLKTRVMETMIVGRLLDDMPLAIYVVDDVLLPEELFKA